MANLIRINDRDIVAVAIDSLMKGDVVTVDGDTNITVEGSTTITSPDVVIKGPGILTCKGVTVPDVEGGPFCAFKVAPPPGTGMVSGYKVMLTDY